MILDVIAAAELGFSVLQHVLTELGSVSRKVAIGISNRSGMKWHAINSRLKHGTSDQVLPYEILSGKINVHNHRGLKAFLLVHSIFFYKNRFYKNIIIIIITIIG